jgi:hypothetical protein
MTNRQYLIRRANRTITATIAGLIIAGLIVTSTPRIFVLRFVFAVVLGAGVAAALWSLFEIPCLSCQKAMGSVGFWVASGRKSAEAPICPCCGISVDTEVPKKT